MAIKTGIDILARFVSLTRPGADATVQDLDRVKVKAKSLQSDLASIGGALNIARGGAVVAGASMIVRELESVAVQFRELANQARASKVSVAEVVVESALLFRTFGLFTRELGGVLLNLKEAAFGTEFYAAEQRRLDDAFKASLATMQKANAAQIDRTRGLENEVWLLESSAGVDARRAEEAVRQIRERILLTDTMRRQQEDLDRAREAGGFQATQGVVRLKQLHQEEIDLLHRKLRAEEQLRSEAAKRARDAEEATRRQALEEMLGTLRRRLTDDALTEEERRRRDFEEEIQRLREQGLQAQEERRLRELLREQELRRVAEEERRQEEDRRRQAEQAAAEQRERQAALAAAADRLPDIRETRALTGLAESFRARRGENAPIVNALSVHSRLLREIADNQRRLLDQEPRMVSF